MNLLPKIRQSLRRTFGFAVWLSLVFLGAAALADSPPAKAAPAPAVVAADPQVHRLVAGETDFAFQLLQQLARSHVHQNLLCSPFSIDQALEMADNGAGGSTRTAIAAALCLPDMPLADVNSANALLTPSLGNPDPQVRISIANGVWVDRTTPINPAFLSKCAQYYNASAQSVDFTRPSGASTINKWTRDHTQGMIHAIVSPLDLVHAQCVLTDAIYFHGQWSDSFDKSDTQNAPFQLENGTQQTVPMMSRTGSYSYLQTPDLQAIRIPYGQGRLAMYILLPDSTTGLDSLLNALTPDQWNQWVGGMHPRRVALSLPRFHASENVTLADVLTRMGMGVAFGPEANFSPMGLIRGEISQVKHIAVMDVDEQGTTAAASTAVIMRSLAMPMALRMSVNHPFLCAIRDDSTGTILFLGAIRQLEE